MSEEGTTDPADRTDTGAVYGVDRQHMIVGKGADRPPWASAFEPIS